MHAIETQNGLDLIGSGEVAKLIDASIPTIYRKVRAGSLPGPVHSGSSALWRRSDIQAWIAAGRPADVTTWLANREAVAH